MAMRERRNPRAVAVEHIHSLADALLRKRLRALKAKPPEKGEATEATDFSDEELDELAATLEG